MWIVDVLYKNSLKWYHYEFRTRHDAWQYYNRRYYDIGVRDVRSLRHPYEVVDKEKWF